MRSIGTLGSVDMVNKDLEEGQIVLCTVDKIVGTTVFVRLDEYGEDGTVTFSEIAPGRIRNIRDYVIPGKKIVCQILRIREGGVQLSFRRVKPQERKELLDKLNKERSYFAILKTVIGQEKSEKIKEKIREEFTLFEFFEKIRTDPKILEKYVSKEDTEKILKILDSKKEKLKEIKQIFKLSNKSSDGMTSVKNILEDSCKGTKCDITYLAAGKYAMTITGEDFKAIKTEINKTMDTLEKLAKKNHSDFSVEKS